jgi:type IV secretory pathway component VirB8
MKLSLGVQEILSLVIFSTIFFTLVFLLLRLIKNESTRNFIKKLYYLFIILATLLIGNLIFNLIRQNFIPAKQGVSFTPVNEAS